MPRPNVSRFIAASAVFVLLAPLFVVAPTARAVSFSMPEQSHCDNGSTTLTWAGEGIARPVIASMTVDGETIADPANPELNSLGAVICPGTTKGNRTGVSVIWHTAQGNTAELTDALTPNGDPVTTETQIAITMTDLGDNAANLTFALVYGNITSWTTANLGTADASLSFTMTPVRTPQGSGDDFNLCTAVPPNCTANKSDADVMGASLALSFEPNVGTQMRGAYFALTGAMGGYVTSATAADGSKTLVSTLGAPHFLADGTTLNTGSMTAFLPQGAVNSLFGLTTGDVDTTLLDVVRTSGSTSSSAIPFTITPVTGGIKLTVPTITFSSPKYIIKMTTAGVKKQKYNAVTPSRSRSALKVVGSNVKANGKATYTLQVTVKNKLGKTIKVPIALRSSNAGVTIGKPVFQKDKWIVKVSTKSRGQKTILMSAKGVTLAPAKVTFVK